MRDNIRPNSKKIETRRGNLISRKPMKRFSQNKNSPMDQVLHLQRTIGNRAVTRLINTGKIQANLKIGKPNDIYEKEADSVADRVMSMPEEKGSLVQKESTCPECPEKEGIQTKPLVEQITSLIQRQANEEEEVQSKLQRQANEEEEEEPVQTKLQRQAEEEEEKEPIQTKVIQRQGTEEEEEPVQTKLLQRQGTEEEEEAQTKLQRQAEEEEETAQAKAAPGNAPEVTSNIESNINSMKGGGQPLSESTRSFFEPRFGTDFSQVRVHNDSRAAQTAQSINAKAFTTGKDVVFNSGQYSPGTTPGKHLLAHELTHVVQQGSSTIYQNSPTESIWRAAPAVVPVVIWFGKALAATSIDALIDYAIAKITGMPPPGFLAHVGNFFINLVPFLGEAKKVKKAAKLIKVIDKILDIVRTFKRLKVPGASNLLKKMTKEADHFKDALKSADLSKAKAAFGRLLGFLREAQITSKLKEKGATIKQLGKTFKKGGKTLTEVDIITEEAGKVVFNQVKAGKRAVLTPGSTDWPKFVRQAEETVKKAGEAGAKVRYYVDDITEEAKNFLVGKGIEVRMSGAFLK